MLDSEGRGGSHYLPVKGPLGNGNGTQAGLFLSLSVLILLLWLKFAWKSQRLTYPAWFAFPAKEGCV